MQWSWVTFRFNRLKSVARRPRAGSNHSATVFWVSADLAIRHLGQAQLQRDPLHPAAISHFQFRQYAAWQFLSQAP
jgi:hypothetical protein